MVKLMATAQQSSLPNFTAEVFGVGGNWGVLLGAVIFAVIMVLYGLLIAFCTTYLVSLVTGDSAISLTTNPLSSVSGAVATGVELAKMAVPFGLMFALLSAYLIWLVSKNTVGMFFAIAMRFVFD